jgi:predicted ArsR family transcriptional regulator
VASARWEKRFLESTRGRIVALLRRTSRTVDELAAALDLTDNAVRAHIATLERDGLVEQRGVRRGTSKPAFSYDLTAEAEQLFPKAYAPVLAHLLTLLTERLSPEAVDDLLRAAGRRIASEQPPAGVSIESRLDLAAHLLTDLGGLAEYEVTEDQIVIRGYSCPLAAIAPDHPAVCHLAESLVSEIVGVPMHEECARTGRPRCVFVGALPSAR